MSEEYFWLIEHAASSPAKPMYLTTIPGIGTQHWAPNPFKAMRWREQKDAETYATTFYKPNYVRVCCHGFDRISEEPKP